MLLETLRGVLAQAADPNQVLWTILHQAITRTGADRGVFVEVTEKGDLEYRVLHRMQRDELEGGAGRFSRSIFAEVIRTGEGVLVADALSDARFMARESVQDLRLVSVLCMPIRAGGKVAALVHLECNRREYFRSEHEAMLRPLVEIAGPVLETLQTGREVLRERDQLRVSERRYREEAQESRELLARDWSFGRFVGRSTAVRELEETITKAAKVESAVLIVGETGTGKSILARVLHHAGSRPKRAFVTVFCPSLEKGMVEAELFGHRKGAFTGALVDRIGKLQAAEKGTLFLDEIGELPLEIQPKLLRLLQERTYERVGDPEERRADVRVIAATNRDLEVEVRTGRFRRDLFERLNFIPIRVPPLRERTEDIPLLLRHCLDQHEAGRWIEVSKDASDYLVGLEFTWPGNVRHVEQLAARLAMEGGRRAVMHADIDRHLGAVPLEPSGIPAQRSPDQVETSKEPGLTEFLAHAERRWLEENLHRYRDLTRAELAKKLRVSESLLYKKLRLYGIRE